MPVPSNCRVVSVSGFFSAVRFLGGRPHLRLVCPSLLTTLLLCWPALILAVEVRVSKEPSSNTVVGSDERIDDTLIATGDTVTIDGVVSGNVIAAARRVTVNGTIEGDLIAAAREVELPGTVEGNAFTFSQEIELNGEVGESLHSFAEQVRVSQEANVEGDFIAFGSEVSTDGSVGRDVLAFAGMTDVRGRIGRNLTAWTGRLSVVAPAEVDGNLIAHVGDPEDVQVESGATIGGQHDIQVRPPDDDRSRFARPGFYLWQVFRLGAGFVTGLALFLLFPALFANRPEGGAALLRNMGIGFLALVATPVAAVIVTLTVFGLPIGLLGLLCWLVGLYFAALVVTAFAGQVLLKKPFDRLGSFALALLVGLLLWVVVTSVPFLGAFVRFLAVLLGLGLIVNQVRAHLQSREAS